MQFPGRDRQPQPECKRQRNNLERKVVEDIMPDEIACFHRSPPGLECDSGDLIGISSSVSSKILAPFVIEVGSGVGGTYRRSNRLMRSRSWSTVRSRSTVPPTARLMLPVSSETMTAMASVSS